MERRYDRCGNPLRDPGGCRAQRRSVDPDRRGDGASPGSAERSHRHAGWWPARGHGRRLRRDRGARGAAGPRRGSRWNGPRRRCAGARPPQDYLAALTRRRRSAASASKARTSQADCALELEHPPPNPPTATWVPFWLPASGGSLPASGAETVPPSEEGGSLPASGAGPVPPSKGGGGGGGGGRSLPSACRMSAANSARAVAISSAVAVAWYVVGNTLRAMARAWLPNPSVLARLSNS